MGLLAALAAAHLHSVGVARAGPWNTWVHMGIARPHRPGADRDREQSVHRRTMNNNPAPIAAVPMSNASPEAPPVLGSSAPLGIVERITPSLADGVLSPAVVLVPVFSVFAVVVLVVSVRPIDDVPGVMSLVVFVVPVVVPRGVLVVPAMSVVPVVVPAAPVVAPGAPVVSGVLEPVVSVIRGGGGGCASEQSTISSGNSQPFMTSPLRMLL